MEIVSYQKQYKNDFIDLNLAWLNKYFKIEKNDLDMLNGVESLIEQGAAVYFALDQEKVIATCMIIPRENCTWEICKLATNEKYQGNGAGSAVLKACMNHAVEHGAKKLMIVSNRILTAAMHLYSKMGFYEVPIDNMEYERVNIQLELKIK